MKKVLVIIIPFFLFAFVSNEQGKKKPNCYSTDEAVEYRVHYGFVNAGEARMEIHPKYYLVNNKVCYKATVTGKSTGAFEFALKIRDVWGSYIDTATLVPQRAYRNIEEGKYRLKENAFFDYNQGIVNVEREMKEKKTTWYKVPSDVQDIVSGYFYLRTLDYTSMRVNDTIKLHAFFEDKLYDFHIKFLGRSKVKTKYGTISAIKLSPLLPENKLFEGENAIRVWLSDDQNKIPLKIEADLLVGAVEMDIKNYKGLKYPIHFSKD